MHPENKVEFDTEKTDDQRRRKILYSRIEPSSIEPRLICFLIEKHIIKNERQGDIILVTLFLICVIASVVVFEYSSNVSTSHVTNSAVLKTIIRQ